MEFSKFGFYSVVGVSKWLRESFKTEHTQHQSVIWLALPRYTFLCAQQIVISTWHHFEILLLQRLLQTEKRNNLIITLGTTHDLYGSCLIKLNGIADCPSCDTFMKICSKMLQNIPQLPVLGEPFPHASGRCYLLPSTLKPLRRTWKRDSKRIGYSTCQSGNLQSKWRILEKKSQSQ